MGSDDETPMKMETKALSTCFVERMWTEKNINDFLDAKDGKWSKFWMAIALNQDTLCAKAWDGMESHHKIDNIFDLVDAESTKTCDRVIGQNKQLFVKYAKKLRDEIELPEDQKKKLSTFFERNPVNNVLQSDDEKENDSVIISNDNEDEIQSAMLSEQLPKSTIAAMITKESDGQNRMNSNENESDSVRSDFVEKLDDAMNGDDQKELNRNEQYVE